MIFMLNEVEMLMAHKVFNGACPEQSREAQTDI